MTKKLPNHLDDPVDNIMYSASEYASEPFKNTCHTPNTITTYSLITGMIACYFLYKNKIHLFIPIFIISYFFDCFDGYFARKYKMTSKWGDIYDHSKDASVCVMILFILYVSYKKWITPVNLLIMGFLFIMLTIHSGCQQTYYHNKNSKELEETLDASKKMCRDETDLKYTRFFGPGMFTIFSVLMIYWIWYKKNKKL